MGHRAKLTAGNAVPANVASQGADDPYPLPTTPQPHPIPRLPACPPIPASIAPPLSSPLPSQSSPLLTPKQPSHLITPHSPMFSSQHSYTPPPRCLSSVSWGQSMQAPGRTCAREGGQAGVRSYAGGKEGGKEVGWAPEGSAVGCVQ